MPFHGPDCLAASACRSQDPRVLSPQLPRSLETICSPAIGTYEIGIGGVLLGESELIIIKCASAAFERLTGQ